ncbi:MAG: hypothetical protein WC352_03215, partial [Candidatus Omnitrophota bacterium]
MKMIRTLALLTFATLLCGGTPPPLFAEEEESLTSKAASGLLDSLPDYFSDVEAMRNMTASQRVDYVLTKAEDRIKEKIAAKFQDDMKKGAVEYAKAAWRAKAFMEIAMPKIRSAILMDPKAPKFDWSTIDAELNHEVEVKANLAVKAIDTAMFTYEIYQKASQDGAFEAFKAASSKVYDSLAGSYIPGWAYTKIGVEMVKFLGNFILDYATDTAIEGMMEAMYDIKSNPGGLAKWLVDKSPAEIAKDVDSKWEFVQSGYLYKGQGTDKADDAMRQRITDTLVSMRGEILVKMKEAEQKEAEARSRAEGYLRDAKNAEDRIRETGKKAETAAAPALSAIRDFKSKVLGIKKQEAEVRVAEAEKIFQASSSGTKSAKSVYVPLPRAAIVGALEKALAEIQESGTSGYDAQKMNDAYTAYQKYREIALADANTAASRDFNQASLMDPDLKLLAAEEAAAWAAAEERAGKMGAKIEEGIRALNAKMLAALKELEQGLQTITRDMPGELNFPEALTDHRYVEKILEATYRPSRRPGDYQTTLGVCEEVLEKVKRDKAVMVRFAGVKKQLYAKYKNTIREIRDEFTRLVPAKIARITVTEASGAETYQLALEPFQSIVKLPRGPDFIATMVQAPDSWGLIDLEADMKEPDKLAADYAPVFEALERRLEEARTLAGKDKLAVEFTKTFTAVAADPALREALERDAARDIARAEEIFPLESNGTVMTVLPKKSEGARYLEGLKDGFQKHSGAIKRLTELRERIQNDVLYAMNFQGSFYAPLDRLNSIPERIRAYEAGLEQAEKDYRAAVSKAALESKNAREALELLRKDSAMKTPDKIERLKGLKQSASLAAERQKAWDASPELAAVVQGWPVLVAQINGEISALEKQAAADEEEKKRVLEESARKSREAEQARKREEQMKFLEQSRREEERRRQESSQQAAEAAPANAEQLVAEAMKKIADAYEAQDLNRFGDSISRDFLGSKATLLDGVRQDFDCFSGVRLALYINRIQKNGGQYAADVRWDKNQIAKKNGQGQKISGNTTFLFVLEDGAMKVKSLKGSLLYASLSVEIAESSGLSSKAVEEVRKAREEDGT